MYEYRGMYLYEREDWMGGVFGAGNIEWKTLEIILLLCKYLVKPYCRG